MNEEAQVISGDFDRKNEQDSPLVLALDDASATLERVGGKGASLARLTAAGLPGNRFGRLVQQGLHLRSERAKIHGGRLLCPWVGLC